MTRILLLTLVSVLLVACGGGDPKDDDASSSSSSSSSGSSSSSSSSGTTSSGNLGDTGGNSAAGEELYQDGCQICHGSNGEGSTQLNAPALVDCSICSNRAALASYIETSMPPGGAQAALTCSGQCAQDVAAYVLEAFNVQADYAACDYEPTAPSPSELKRLSRQEYSSTLIDLLQLSSPPNVAAIPDDPSIDNFKTVASVQNIQASHLSGYIDIATEQAEALMSSPERRDSVLGCDYTNQNCIDDFVTDFGRLAYRRPLTSEEFNRIITQVNTNSTSTADQFVLAIQLLLSSPHFIYRVEVGDTPEGLARLNSYELASRLAFSLWGRGPDAELLDQAQDGELDSAEGLSRIASQMLTDERAKESVSSFFEQWLATNLLQAPVDKPANWYGDILQDMKNETDTLLREFAWQDKDFMGIFTGNHTYLSPGLASYYGLPRPQSADVATQLPSGDARQNTGILTHAANMFPKTDGDTVAIRGDWLRATFLCKDLELPEGVSEIIDDELSGLTSLEIIAERNQNASCNRCHAQIDPIGVAFASFNEYGLYDHSIDLADFPLAPGFPDADDSSIDTVQDIAQALSRMPEVSQCLADRLFLYTRNHAPVENDRCAVRNASQEFQNSGNDFAALLLALVEDPSFRVRQAPQAGDEAPDAEPELQNVALYTAVTASSAQDGNPASRLTDNDITGESRWSAQVFPQQATIDLGGIYTIVQSEVYPYMDRAYQYRIEVSTDGTTYRQVVNRGQNTQGGNVISDVFTPVDARYVKVVVSGASGYTEDWVSFRELKIFGTR